METCYFNFSRLPMYFLTNPSRQCYDYVATDAWLTVETASMMPIIY